MKRSRTINRKFRFDCSRGGPEYSRWTESKRTIPLDLRRKCRSFWHNGAAQAALVSGIKSSRSLMLDDDITFGELSSVWAIPGLDNKKSEALRQLSVKARLSKLPKELFYYYSIFSGNAFRETSVRKWKRSSQCSLPSQHAIAKSFLRIPTEQKLKQAEKVTASR